MHIISGFIIASLCFTIIYIFGVFVFITDHAENKCEMTYMFQYPQFVRISMNTYPQYHKYALYAYSEGRFTENTRNMQFEGVPVLFVPGNAGSYKQVRSLASVALRKALSDRPGFHFDYFTVDLNEELSGINGALLQDQTRFVNHSITRVLELYQKSSKPPKSVVLIGHSMGGIILRSLLSTFPLHSEIAPLVITLATPHIRPPVIFDGYMSGFYKNLEGAVLPNKTVLISIAGGYNDFLVPSYLSNLNSNSSQSLYAVSTSVPRVWLPTDHLCILWCKQLVLAINRALFDSIDLRAKRLSLDPKRLHFVFHHHLVHNSGIKLTLAQRYDEPILNLDNRGEWFESLYRQYSVEQTKNSRQIKWYMIRYSELPQHEMVTVLALNMEADDWVYACPAIYVRGQSRICNDGIHLTHKSTMAPSLLHKRRVVDVNMHQLKTNYTRLTHVVVRVLPNDDPVILHVDVYNPQRRTVNAPLPHILSFQKRVIIHETDEKAVRYNIVFEDLQHVIQSYKLYVEPISCVRMYHHATASLNVPWANEGVHAYFTEEINEPFHLRLHSSRPRNNTQSATVQLTLDPVCKYQISIRSSLSGTLGQLARLYSGFLIANVAVVVLMALRHQLKAMSKEKSCSFFLAAVTESGKPLYVVPAMRIASTFLRWGPLREFVPNLDGDFITNEGLDFLVLPLLLYICAVGIVWILALALSCAIIVSESTIQRIALMFLARSFTGTLAFSDYLLSGLHKLPIIVAAGLIVLSFCTCGGLALCVGSVFYFLKLTQMSQEFAEQLIWGMVKQFGFRVKKLFKKERSGTITGTEATAQSSEDLAPPSRNDTKVGSVAEENGKSGNNESGIEDGSNEAGQSEINQGDSEEERKQTAKVVKTNKKEVPLDTAIFFHFTLFLLWSLTAALCIPSVLTWAHNFRYNTRLVPDPSFWPGLILCICAVPLWQLDLPKFNRKWYKLIGELTYILAIVSLLYAVISLYRLVYLLTLSIVIITLHQLFAPAEAETEKETKLEANTYTDRVKAKLE